MSYEPFYSGHVKRDKWLGRAIEYEGILAEEGVEAGEKYVARYLGKIDRFLDALWKLHQLRRKERKIESIFP